MWLHRRSEEPEPTAVQCYWKKPVLAQVGSNIKFLTAKMMKKPEKNYDFLNTDAFFDEVVAELSKRQCNTQISRHCFLLNSESNKNYSLHKLMLDFVETGGTSAEDFVLFAKSQMSADECIRLSDITKDQADSKLWEELRYCRITASKIHEVAHCKTVDGSLVERIIGVGKCINTDAIERGKALEKDVVTKVEVELGIKLNECGLILNPEYPILGASPDAVGPDFVVEIKCPISEKTKQQYLTATGVTKKHLAQIQLQMFMRKVKRGYFCVAEPDYEMSNAVTIIPVQYDEKFTTNLMEKSMSFWKNAIFPKLYKSVK